jgi:hypothetical protein
MLNPMHNQNFKKILVEKGKGKKRGIETLGPFIQSIS